jgi:hypothetical protein
MSTHNVCYLGGMYGHVGRSCFNVSLNGRRRHALYSVLFAFLMSHVILAHCSLYICALLACFACVVCCFNCFSFLCYLGGMYVHVEGRVSMFC